NSCADRPRPFMAPMRWAGLSTSSQGMAVTRRRGGSRRRAAASAMPGAHALRDIAGWWNMALDYGFYDRGSNALSPGVAPSAQTPSGIPANGDNARFTRHEVTWTNRLTPLPGLDADRKS